MKRFHLARDESGQAAAEYIILLAIVVGFYLMAAKLMDEAGLASAMVRPVQNQFKATFKYGHPKAVGYDEGQPQNHPRVADDGGTNNFRLFLNPGEQ